MKQEYQKWIPLPDGVLRMYKSERQKKAWVEGYIRKNYRGWKPIEWNIRKEIVLCRWEGGE